MIVIYTLSYVWANHFEFQTTNKVIEDLMRFRTYGALLNHQTKKYVTTDVVYSGDIKIL